MIFKQTLLYGIVGNMGKTVWRIFILMLRCNGLSLGSRDQAEQRALLPLLWSMFISWPSITFGMSLLLVLDFTLRIFLWVPPFFPLKKKKATLQIPNSHSYNYRECRETIFRSWKWQSFNQFISLIWFSVTSLLFLGPIQPSPWYA